MEDLNGYIEHGGVIVYILIALNIIGFSIMLYKLVEIVIYKRARHSVIDNMLSESDHSDKSIEFSILKDNINNKIIRLEKGLGVVKNIATIAPLLGLLGTVIGVLLAFEAISKQGMDDPSIFAGGISMALITTVAGLIVAIPHYIGYNSLIAMLDRLEALMHSELGVRLSR